MKKNRIYLIIAATLLAVCLVLVLFKTGVFHGKNSMPKSDIFAVKDTASITKVFIADMNGEQVLLSKRDNQWYVQDTIPAMPSKIDDLLSTINNITLQQVVAKTLSKQWLSTPSKSKFTKPPLNSLSLE